MKITMPDIKPCGCCGEMPVTSIFPGRKNVLISIECKNPACTDRKRLTYNCQLPSIEGMLATIKRAIAGWNEADGARQAPALGNLPIWE